MKQTVKKDVKKALQHPKARSNVHKTNLSPTRGARASGARLDHRGAADTAFVTLNPDAAADYELNPGICDSQLHNDDVIFTKTRILVSSVQSEPASPTFTMRVAAFPFMDIAAKYVTSFAVAGVPATTTAVSNIMYLSALSNADYYTCLGMCMTVRCLDAPLTLNGTRQFIAGDQTTFLGTSASLISREDSFLMGNNKAGDILRALWVPKTPFELRQMTAPVGLNDGAVVVSCVTTTACNWEVEVFQVLALQNTQRNSLVPKDIFVGNASEYSEYVAESFAKEGLYSQSRCAYSDDGWFSSLWSDVKGILGVAGKAAWSAAKPILLSGAQGMATKGIAGLFGGAQAPPVELRSAALLLQMDDPQLQAVIDLCALDSNPTTLRDALTAIVFGVQQAQKALGLRADVYPTPKQIRDYDEKGDDSPTQISYATAVKDRGTPGTERPQPPVDDGPVIVPSSSRVFTQSSERSARASGAAFSSSKGYFS